MAEMKMRGVLEIGAELDSASLSAAFGKIRKEQAKLTDAIEDNKLEQKALNAQMKGLAKSSPQLAKLREQYAAVGEAIKRDELAVIELQRQQRKLKSTGPGDESSSRWQTLGKSLGSVGGQLRGLATTAAGAGVAIAGMGGAAFAGLQHVAEGMAHTHQQAKRLGVSTDTLQELRFAAAKTGVEAQDLDDAMASMVATIGEGAEGPAAEGMKALGLSMGWIQKQAPEEQLAAIAETLQNIAPNKRLTTLATIFGEDDAKKMINILQDGSAGLEAMRQEARDMGAVISKENLEASQKFTADLLNLKTAAFAALAPIAVSLMPKVIEGFREGVAWIQSNREGIASFGETLANVTTTVIGWVGAGAKMIGTVLELVGGFDQLAQLVGAFWLAMEVGLLGNPITAGLFGLAMAVKAVYDNWDDLVIIWRDFVQPQIDHITDSYSYLWKLIQDSLPSFDALSSAWDSVVGMLPGTETAGTAPPTGAAPGAGGGHGGAPQVNQQINVSAGLDQESIRDMHRKASEEANRALTQGAGFSQPAPGAV